MNSRDACVYLLALMVAATTLLAVSHSSSARATSDAPPVTYSTWSGLGPDKWASIWLIQSYITTGERVRLVPYNTHPEDVQLFDVPGSAYYRTNDETTFSQLASGLGIESRNVQLLGQIVHDIEINLWLPDSMPQSRSVETAFRSMQAHFGRDRVPYICYMAFFDTVADQLQTDGLPESLSLDVPLITASCEDETMRGLAQPNVLVPQMPVTELLDVMRASANVVFVDVREPEEFAETHIPGAVNILIRDLDDTAIEMLRDADLVVAYCVKDFRGFEMARMLQQRGIKNAVILDPFGLKGWINLGLPVTRQGSMSDEGASEALARCLDRDNTCAAIL